MSKLVVLILLAIAGSGLGLRQLSAQSLADVAKKEEERRKAVPAPAKVYTNKDVADIDNRLRNVEYYTNLNQLESSVKTLIIPSSSDPTVNRYQFGFFADDFSTNGLTDGSNPTYRAMLEDGDIVPSKLTWEVYMGDEFSGSQSYVTTSIISQLNATIGNHSDPKAKPQCAVGLANTIAYQTVFRNAYDFNNLPPQDGQTDLVSFQLADAQHMNAANAAVRIAMEGRLTGMAPIRICPSSPSRSSLSSCSRLL